MHKLRTSIDGMISVSADTVTGSSQLPDVLCIDEVWAGRQGWSQSLGLTSGGNGPDQPWEGGGEQMLSGGRELAGDLMKPVDQDKLAETLERVRVRLAEKRSAEEAEKLKSVLAEVAPDAMDAMPDEGEPAAARYEKLINIKDKGQIFRVDVDSIERIEAAGDYMVIYTADNSLILRETMKDLERRLDPRVFQRVHRSWIVNLNQVRQVKPHTNGECFLVLESGADVKVSRSYRDVVARFVH